MSEPADLVVRGGTVVNDGWSGPATICVSGERITQLLSPTQRVPQDSRTRVIDATGMLVMPGGVDPHAHIDMTIGPWHSLDDYPAATTAALAGGTTTVVDFAIPRPGQRPLDAVLERQAAAATGACDAALHGCVVQWDATTREQLQEMAGLGVRTVKLFTTYRDVVMASSRTVLRVMEALQEIGGLAVVHAEANHLVEAQEEELESQGALGADNHAASRTELAELDAVERVLAIAEHLGVSVYFVHQTTGAAVAAVREARRRGVHAYSETCPHYLALDSSVYDGPHPERFVCCPPIRPRTTVAELRRAAATLDVHTVGSDHCCYDTAQKRSHRHDVRAMPAGLPGIETRLPVTWTTLVEEGGMSPSRFVALVSANPARLNGLYPRKGVLAPGSDADIVVLDPTSRRTVRAGELHMRTDYTPYEGLSLSGWPRTVVTRGAVVLEDGLLNAESGRGRALASEAVWGAGRLC